MTIKLIVFDLDGVLVDTCQLHRQAFRVALERVAPPLATDEVLAPLDGLTTRQKLEHLTEHHGLGAWQHDRIWWLKQQLTADLVRQTIGPDERLAGTLLLLHANCPIHVASNSARQTVRLLLCRTGLMEHVDYYLGGDDVRRIKPAAEIYLRCMLQAGVDPCETLIIEDSDVGCTAAVNAGTQVLRVGGPDEVTCERVLGEIGDLHGRSF